jgi:uridine phosphorylase
MPLAPSELILNPDGSVYHLHLKPQDIAHTIITVGDPDRVDSVTALFDSIRFTTQKREFKTSTGFYKGKEISVISTGIGTDNIDIVFNELDALVNIDLETREIKDVHTSLDIVRIGTSGSIQPDILVDSFLMSKLAIGLDALVHFYDSTHIQHPTIQDAFAKHMDWSPAKSIPYVVVCNSAFAKAFISYEMHIGFTATNIGFYGPQGRVLRLSTNDASMNTKLASFSCIDPGSQTSATLKITNLEMETAGIYGMSQLLGHRAVSLNAILANRATNTFSASPKATVERLIQYALDCLVNQ